MKKLTIVLVAIVIILSTTVNVSADADIGNTYQIDNVTVVFDVGSQLSREQQEAIANLLTHPEYGVSKANLICNIFGHKNTSETVITITHEAKATSPRCLQENFTVTTCSRCDESTVERNSFGYISCCPEE